MLITIYGPAVAAIVLTFVVADVSGRPFGFFSSDPAKTLQGSPFAGALSQLGILGWCAGASVSLFAWSVLRHSARPTGQPGGGADFFLWSAALTALLLVDDLFLVHENVAPRHLGLGENHVLAGYLLLAAFYAYRFRSVLLRRGEPRWLLLPTCVFFALGLGVDQFQGSLDPWPHALEDVPKLLGIVSWSGYLALSAWLTIEPRFPLGGSQHGLK